MNSERSFRVISRKGGLWLDKDGWTFNLEPPEIVKMSLPPYFEGVDWFIREAMRLKGIEDEYLSVKFSDSLFLGCDANLSYIDSAFGGWTYSVDKEFLEFDSIRKLWICSQMKLYFDNQPKHLFISIERE
jgi:hypothetical protein